MEVSSEKLDELRLLKTKGLQRMKKLRHKVRRINRAIAIEKERLEKIKIVS